MPASLTPDEARVLQHLATAGGAVDEAKLDAAALETLAGRGYVRRLAGYAIISPDGRGALRGAGPVASATPRALEPRPAGIGGVRRPGGVKAEPAPAPEPAAAEEEAKDDGAAVKVNALQEDLLRRLVQERDPLPVDDLDGRVVRALEGRGLAQRNAGVLEVTEAGRAFYERNVRRRRRVRSGWLGGAQPPAAPGRDGGDDKPTRAELLLRAVDALAQAIGGDVEIEVGDLTARADEALEGFRELAGRIERGEDPRRITRAPRG